MQASIYGVALPEKNYWEIEREKRVYEYLKEKIRVEFMNPNPPEDLILKLVTEVALSYTGYYERNALIELIDPFEEKENDDE